MGIFLINIADEFNEVVHLFCFKWISNKREIDGYRIDVIFIFDVEDFLYETFLSSEEYFHKCSRNRLII